MPRDDLIVSEDAERRRFEARVAGDLAGVMEYIPLPGRIIATHTETFPPHGGKGVGKRLVKGALELLRADGRLIQPLCPYVTAYLREHREWDDVVDPSAPR